MMKFSERIGKTPVREKLQIDQIDEKLANRLWNNIYDDFFNKISGYISQKQNLSIDKVCSFIWTEFFGKRTDEMPPTYSSLGISSNKVIDYIKKSFFKSEWYEQYDLIELLSIIDIQRLRIGFQEACNYSLKKEMADCQIIDGKVVKITSEVEINEIEEALSKSRNGNPINIHLTAALEFLSDRENPNYRNSIKESISAVESLCVNIAKDNNATLGKALNIIEKEYDIHGALKNAFSSLYGYTSESGGIRHFLMEDDIIATFEDAKFMLVSCSAFINYLKVKNYQ